VWLGQERLEQAYSRHLGYQKRPEKPAHWLARFCTTSGQYRQRRLGEADRDGSGGLYHG
jgi:hypothetical protein